MLKATDYPSTYTGRKYGFLTVLGTAKVIKNGKTYYGYLCECVCGKQVEKLAQQLNAGNAKSCGCQQHKRGKELKDSMKMLVFDPSGNHTEGNGTSGWAVFIDDELMDFGDIRAADYTTPEAYWLAHWELIKSLKPDAVLYETYKLQAGKAMQQSWSQLETPQLIGLLRSCCWMYKIKMFDQDPKVKPRFSDEVLVNTGYAERKGKIHYIRGRATNMHMRDAIRHGLYFRRYGKDKLHG